MIKEIPVNWNDISDLSKTISRLQKRRKELIRQKYKFAPIKYGNSERLNAPDILDLLNYFRSIPCPGVSLTDRGEYYVYVHCNPLQPLKVLHDIRDTYLATNYFLQHKPFYVGKGRGDRCYNLNRNDSHRKLRTSIREQGQEAQVYKILDNLTEKEALFEEQKLIILLGLKALSPHGYLVNLQTEVEVLEIFKKYIEDYPPINKKVRAKAENLINKKFSKWV